MTEYVEICAPLKEVKIALGCKSCTAEILIDPTHEKQRWEGGRTMQCPMCSTEIDSSTVSALGLFMRAVGQARSPMSVIVRRAVA
jgi:hypothetical protein